MDHRVYDWERLNAPADLGEPLLTLEFQEAYTVEFYSGGHAVAYNGYGMPWNRCTAYYEVPEEIVNRIVDYVLANSI